MDKQKLNPNDYESDIFELKLSLKGLKRFKVIKQDTAVSEDLLGNDIVPRERNVREERIVSICSGKNISDSLIVQSDYVKDSENPQDIENLNSDLRNIEIEAELRKQEEEKLLREEITGKALYIKDSLVHIIRSSSISIQQLLGRKFGPPKLLSPQEAERLKNSSIKDFISYYESFVYHIVWMLKLAPEEKILAFKSLNLYRKVDNIFRIFKNLENKNLMNNQSIAIELFDLKGVAGSEVNNLKFFLFIVIV
eukprot:CAMPEP_0170523232 /NCGR_PEP_ID=MMETSP0209-20121228/8671_1 /TAXON_ID=665100 ORGANISM="Litonotus pictus, Strain P1" /NCGR_SAMPLE_ID=MMETSP0209 /ASSEMBLY_ACC=CAM_ASM_000301 /LENGTH=251 /DNA_ID=CAMNT_0010811215 /DNA_START=466 /DNA_END=1218 /DNA_ORIENTATION=+